MKTAVVTRQLITSILFTLMMGGMTLGRGQESNTNALPDVEKAEIVESVLQLELKGQNSLFGSGFGHVRNLSSEHIEFIAPSRISALGVVLLSASQIRELKRDQVVEYVILRRIDATEGKVIVRLSRVTEGRACFATVSDEQRFAYEYRKTFGKWTGELLPVMQLLFGSPSKTKGFTGRSLKTALEQWNPGLRD